MINIKTGDNLPTIKNSLLTINNAEYNIDSLTDDITKPCYIVKTQLYENDEILEGQFSEEKIINLEAPKTHTEFILKDGNLKRFYSIDLKNTDVETIKKVVDIINKPVEALQVELKTIINKFKEDNKDMNKTLRNRKWLQLGK